MNSPLQQLQWALQALAQPAEIQISMFPPYVVIADELALEFSHWLQFVISSSRSLLTDTQVKTLESLDDFIADSKGSDDADHWTVLALRSDPFWSRIRSLACDALVILDWPVALPPINPVERGAIYLRRE